MSAPCTINDLPHDILIHHIFPQVNCMATRWHVLPQVCKAWNASLATASPAYHSIIIPSSARAWQPDDAFRDKLRHVAPACACLTVDAGQSHALTMVVSMFSTCFGGLRTLHLHSTLSLTMVKVVCEALPQLSTLSLHLTTRGSEGANATDYNMAALARLQQLQV